LSSGAAAGVGAGRNLALGGGRLGAVAIAMTTSTLASKRLFFTFIPRIIDLLTPIY